MGRLTTVAVSTFLRCEGDDCGTVDVGAVVDRYICGHCMAQYDFGPDRWSDWASVAVHDHPYMKSGSEITRDLDRLSARIVTRTTEPVCAVCKATITMDAVERGLAGGSVACGACAAKLLVRPVPEAFGKAFHGITHLLGEDIGQLANPERAFAGEPSVATCPSCGEGVQVDGKSRAVQCAKCKNMVVVPRELYLRFQRNLEPHTFYFVHDDSIPRAEMRPAFHWTSVRSVTADRSGDIYAIADDEDCVDASAPVLVAFDCELRTRWVRRDVHIKDAHLACQSDALILWTPNQSTAQLLDTTDGEVTGDIGAEQPPGVQAHTLDFRGADAIAVDIDDSIVLLKDHRIVRCSPKGKAIPIWPARKGFLGFTRVEKTSPFTGDNAEDAPTAETIVDYPATTSGHVALGVDGSLYVWSRNHVASFDRTGKKRWTVAQDDIKHVCGDPAGVAFCMSGDTVVRIHEGKSQLALAEVPHDADELVCRPDGSVVVFGSDYGQGIIAPSSANSSK